ncbi:MAG: dUTP diphosphatase [Helicobacter sp.]|nr:dUTP diphosphatase [Helicobacter sp.]
MKINIKLLDKRAKIPQYQSAGASGFDLCAIEPCIIAPQSCGLIKTGLCFEIPDGFELQIRSRSGLAAKNNVAVLNSPGTVDSDYRGEVMILLFNFGSSAFEIIPGNRIAQGVISSFIKADFNISDSLNQTARNEAGFGSSGL